MRIVRSRVATLLTEAVMNLNDAAVSLTRVQNELGMLSPDELHEVWMTVQKQLARLEKIEGELLTASVEAGEAA